jgi:hypothetical protein
MISTPTFVNSSGDDVSVAVHFADGTTSSFVWKKCRLTSFGKPRVAVVGLQIYYADKLQVSYGPQEVRELVLKQEQSRALTAWRFDGHQLSLVDEAAARASARCVSGVAVAPR